MSAIVQRLISVRVQLPGIHHWPAAWDSVKLLAHEHRHMFHVRTVVRVDHSDRQEEFIVVRGMILARLKALYPEKLAGLDFGPSSCETIAERLGTDLRLLDKLMVAEVGVSEDGEFEGIVQWRT